MDITPPADDKGVSRLKLDNEKSEVKQTSAVSPYPRIESTEEHYELRPPTAVERRQNQRRINERREHHQDTAYDTRGHEDRRKHKRRLADRSQQAKTLEDASSATDVPFGHIDEKV